MADNQVIPAGFEPTTHSLEGCCSIQLSYGTNAQKSVRREALDFCVGKINAFISFLQVFVEFYLSATHFSAIYSPKTTFIISDVAP